MEISIYVEYPEKELDNLHLVRFPADIHIAGKSLNGFDNQARQVYSSNSQIKRVGYWPTLDPEEGYWMSAFADPMAIERVTSELAERNSEDERLLLTWDAEIPHQTPTLMARNLPRALKTRRDIQGFLASHEQHNLDIVVAQFAAHTMPVPAPAWVTEKILGAWGTHFDPHKYNIEGVAEMTYTSFGKYPGIEGAIFHNFTPAQLIKAAERGVQRHGDKYAVGIGALATGEMRNEPTLTVPEFERDLKAAKQAGVERVFIYRLGGLTQDHVDIIKELTQ